MPQCLAFVRIPLDTPRSAEAAIADARQSAPRFQALAGDGLLSKHYLNGTTDEGRSQGGAGGGVYVWSSRAAAAAFYDDRWAEKMTVRFGARPSVELFDVHSVLDTRTATLTVEGEPEAVSVEEPLPA